jgi:hypothetical protein
MEKLFFEKLFQHPEAFGYELILKSKRRDGAICILQRGIHKIYYPRIYFGIKGNAEQYQQEGWNEPEDGFTRTNGQSANLLIKTTSKPKSDIIMNASVYPFIVPGKLEKQRVIININGRKAGEWDVPADGEYNLTIPKDFIKGNELNINFVLPDAIAPIDLGFKTDTRVLGLAIKDINLSEISKKSLVSPN